MDKITKSLLTEAAKSYEWPGCTWTEIMEQLASLHIDSPTDDNRLTVAQAREAVFRAMENPADWMERGRAVDALIAAVRAEERADGPPVETPSEQMQDGAARAERDRYKAALESVLAVLIGGPTVADAATPMAQRITFPRQRITIGGRDLEATATGFGVVPEGVENTTDSRAYGVWVSFPVSEMREFVAFLRTTLDVGEEFAELRRKNPSKPVAWQVCHGAIGAKNWDGGGAVFLNREFAKDEAARLDAITPNMAPHTVRPLYAGMPLVESPTRTDVDCIGCGRPVGNSVFTYCDDCWDARRNGHLGER